MPRKFSGRGYPIQPPQAGLVGAIPVSSGFGNPQHQYYYQGISPSYYGLQYYQNPSGYPNNSWYQNGNTGYYPPPTTAFAASAIGVSSFSPDAPEFVPKALRTTAGTGGANQPSNGKPKKKKKKKKSTADTSEKPSEPVELVPAKGILLESSKTQQSKASDVKFDGSIAEQAKVSTADARISESHDAITAREKETRPQKSVKFLEPIKETCYSKKEKKAQKSNAKVEPSEVIDATQTSWPGLQENKRSGAENKMPAPPRMSFADKLKSAPAVSPFLDWRDQRTNANNPQPRPTSAETPKQPEKPPKNSPEKVRNDRTDDGFITVTRKSKGKEKKQEVPAETSPSPQQEKAVEVPKKSAEEIAKKKAEREKKKEREKEKKRLAREEKLLAEKLAPKGQKVTFITPAIMEKFLKNKRPATTAARIASSDEFPALGVKSRGNVSESESEWETTEVEVQVNATPNATTGAATKQNVKKSDPIKYDLMALITKKTNLKQKPKSDGEKKAKTRTGVVANVLDRSAPVLSRGKIRNKKPKLSGIRKAIVTAKAKRKALEALTNRPPSQRPHKLHSKKFREYCDQMLTDHIDQLARDMLYHLRTFQDRAFKKDPIKARMKKRLVAGLKEVTKQVERKRIKIIFLAPDIQRCPETGGLDEAVQRLLDAARKHDLSIVYALSRRKMGRVLMKNVPVSCCGVLNYQATEDTWKELSSAVTLARKEYQEKIKQLGLTEPPASQEVIHPAELPNQIPDQPIDQGKGNIQDNVLLDLLKLSLKNQ